MKISRQSLIFGLSYALDIAGKNNLSHSKSVAYLSVMMGRELGYGEAAALSLYYAALLHDIGVSNEYFMYEHCKTGYEMLKNLPVPEDIPQVVLYHHEHIDGSGPLGIKAGSIPKSAQIVALTSAFDDCFGKITDDFDGGFFDRSLFNKIQDWIDKTRRLYSEDVVGAFSELTKREFYLLGYFSNETMYNLSKESAISDADVYDYDDVLKFALCFAKLIDSRSSFTYKHSLGIANHARKAAGGLGYNKETQDEMYIAGLLHDIGKLHVPISILHKNGKLTPEERFEINKHTYYTRKVLEQIPGFENIVEYASNHHEKMDGEGYPYHIAGSKLSELERVMSICDVYQALTEERPYRTPLSEERVWGIIEGMARDGHLDGVLVCKVKELNLETGG